MDNDKFKDLDNSIRIFRELADMCRKERISGKDFVFRYLINPEMRANMNFLYSALEEMSLYSIADFEIMKERGATFRREPRYDFSCLEDSCKEMFYTFSTGKNKFNCDFLECLDNLADFLTNYKAVLKFEERRH